MTMSANDDRLRQALDAITTAVMKKTIRESGLDKRSMQRLIERRDELRSTLKRVTSAVLEDLSGNRYVREESRSETGYPSGYAVKPIAEQMRLLCAAFPSLSDADVDVSIADGPLPEGAEGWFAVPHWFGFGATYHEAISRAITAVGPRFSSRDPGRTIMGHPEEPHIRQCSETANAFVRLVEQQGSSIVVIPAQLGLRYRGCSVRRARERFEENEFGLGLLAVLCLLITHPERFSSDLCLGIDCAGDECRDSAMSTGHCFCPAIEGFPADTHVSRNDQLLELYGAGDLNLMGRWFGQADPYRGSVSAFLLP